MAATLQSINRMLLITLPLLPTDAIEVSDRLAIRVTEDAVEFFNAGGPIASCRQDDRPAVMLAAVNVVQQGLATVTAVSKALGVHRTTLHRAIKRYGDFGVSGVMEQPLGPRGPHKLTPEVQQRAQALLDQGKSMRAVARELGLSGSGIRHAIARGLLSVERTRAVAEPTASPAAAEQQQRDEQEERSTGPRERADEDQACDNGVGVKRLEERALARFGRLVEATPKFSRAESVSGAGVLLALPALLDQGLIEEGEGVFERLSNGFFGLRSVLLTFAFMALLRIKTPEQLTERAPGELGLLLGLDRAPEVKTLRRKLAELGERELAHTFASKLTQRWAAAEPDELGLLYVDGHVRPYNGRTIKLPKLHVQQRGRPMPGTKDFHINNRRADPLLFVTAEATEGLLSTLDETLLPEVRDLVGPERRVIIAFDREGWSPKMFARWKEEKVDVLTYRKGKQTKWQKRFFKKMEEIVEGKPVSYHLAERRVKLGNGLEVREIRRLSDDGHQTAIITTDETLPTFTIAVRMFARWKQENFFRYMRQEFALDHLCTNEIEAADPTRPVTSPARATLEKKLKTVRAHAAKLMEHTALLKRGGTVRVRGRMMDRAEVKKALEVAKREAEQLARDIKALPAKVPVGTVIGDANVVQLERERKVLVDSIKLTVFRAESALARLVEPFFARQGDESRKLLKTIFGATADVLPDAGAGTLTVRFHGLASPRATRALADLCSVVSERNVKYPGTNLLLRFEAPVSQR